MYRLVNLDCVKLELEVTCFSSYALMPVKYGYTKLHKSFAFSAVTDEMHLLPEPLFTLPTDGLHTRALAGTDNGR